MNDQPLKLRQSLKAQWPALVIMVSLGILALLAGPASDVLERGFAEQGIEVFDLTAGVRLVAGLLVGVVFITMVIYPILANRYSLTTDQVQEVNGIIQRHTRTTRLEHVRAVNVEIGFVGRILGYGDVVFFTAGSGGDDVRLTGIDDPDSVARRAEHFARQASPGAKLPTDIGTPSGGTPETIQLMRKAQLQREELKNILVSLQAQQQSNTDRLGALLETLTLRVESLGEVSETDRWQPRKHRSGEAAARTNKTIEGPVSLNKDRSTSDNKASADNLSTNSNASASGPNPTADRDNDKFFSNPEMPLTADPEHRIGAEPTHVKAEAPRMPEPLKPPKRVTRGNIPFARRPEDTEDTETDAVAGNEQAELTPAEKARRRALVEQALSESDARKENPEAQDDEPPVVTAVSLTKPIGPKNNGQGE